jgi:hypothetical protein
MASHRPAIISGGRVKRLPSGDTIAGPLTATAEQQFTNADAGNHLLGEVVYLFGSDSVKKARADAAATSEAFAMATATVANGAVGTYQTQGPITGLSGLTPGATYFLDPTTAGAMTATPPETSGQYAVELGRAVTATEFYFDPKSPLGL